MRTGLKFKVCYGLLKEDLKPNHQPPKSPRFTGCDHRSVLVTQLYAFESFR